MANFKITLPIKKNNFCSLCLKCDNNSTHPDCICNRCIRHNFISECLPYLDIKNHNIINWENNYINFDINNKKTYTINNQFEFEIYKGNQKFEYIKNDVYYRYLNYFIPITYSENNQLIPIYYMFINKNNNIFDIFINYYLYINRNLKNRYFLSFNYNKDDKKFHSMTYKFEIFNVSLLCNKFFDIIPLFLFDEFDNKESIINELTKIFEEFNLEKLYLLINHYKTKINTYANCSKKNEKDEKVYNNFMSMPFKKYDTMDEKKKSILKIENNEIKITKDKIYKEFAINILEYKNYLSKLKEMIPEYDAIFLMSILSYRLKERTIQNTWAFDDLYIYEYIKKIKEEDPDIEYYSDPNSELRINNTYLKDLYLVEKPVVYENSMVTYENSPSYGNCMENTILQFLKILFWDYENNNKYDLTKIQKIVNDVYKQKITEIFNEIEREKTREFDNNWVKFIMELPKNNNYANKNYDFLSRGYELNSTLDNLIIFLRYIVNENKIEENILEDDSQFLNNLVKKINNNYNIIIKKEKEKDIVTINLDKKQKNMILKHKLHAKFENSKVSVNKNNILSGITEDYTLLSEYLKDYKYLTLSEINDYICLDYIENKNDFYKEYISMMENKNIASSYSLIFLDDIITKIDIDIYKKVLLDHISEYLNYKYLDNTVWHIITNRKMNKDFLNIIIEKKLCKTWDIQNFYQDTIWHIFLLKNNISKEFWDVIIHYELYNLWNTKNIKGITVWYLIIKTQIKIDNRIWNIIIKNKLYNSWDIPDKDKNTIWNYFASNLDNNEIPIEFWNMIICNKIYNTWNIDVWDNLRKFNIDIAEKIDKKKIYNEKYIKYKKKYLLLKTYNI